MQWKKSKVSWVKVECRCDASYTFSYESSVESTRQQDIDQLWFRLESPFCYYPVWTEFFQTNIVPEYVVVKDSKPWKNYNVKSE